jgi:Fe-S-cluster containining protein
MTITSRRALPVVTDCTGCGACCTHLNYPPAYWWAAHPLHEDYGKRGRGDRLDWSLWDTMPDDLRGELLRHYGRELAGGYRRYDDEGCLWFDQATRRCKHYEFRPRACREFEVGAEDCLKLRRQKGIDGGRLDVRS